MYSVDHNGILSICTAMHRACKFIKHSKYHVGISILKLEDLTVLKRSPDLLNDVKIGQDQLQLIMKHILLYGGCGHFGQVT